MTSPSPALETVRFGHHFSLFDTLQWVGTWSKSVAYALDHPLLRGIPSRVVVRDGALAEARVGRAEGIAALAALLALPGIQCRVRAAEGSDGAEGEGHGPVCSALHAIEMRRAGRMALCAMGESPSVHYLGDGLHHLGRAEDLGVVLDCEWVSREHAALLVAGEVLYLWDLGSTNGTFVDGTRASQRALALPCELRLGSLRCALSRPEDHHHPSAGDGYPGADGRAMSYHRTTVALRRAWSTDRRPARQAPPANGNGDGGVAANGRMAWR